MQALPSYQETIRSKLDQHFELSLEEPTNKKQMIAKVRPGKKPNTPDSNLSSNQLEKRNARRERNKFAAAKVRKHKENLEQQLILEKQNLKTEVENLDISIEKIRMTLEKLRKFDWELGRESTSSNSIYSKVCEVFPVETECAIFETDEMADLLVPYEFSEFDQILAMKSTTCAIQPDCDMHELNSILEESFFNL